MNEELIRKLIQAELAGEIAPEDEALLQQALAEDPAYRTIYDEERRLAALFAADRAAIAIPEGLAGRISARVLAEAPAGRRFDFLALARRLAAAAAVLLLVGVSFWGGRRSTSAGPDQTGAGLVERRDRLLQELPAGEREAVRDLFRNALEDLARIDRQHDAERSRILEDLENAIRDRVGEGAGR